MTSVRRALACFTIAAFAMSVGVFAADEKKDKKDEKKTPTNKEIMKKVQGKGSQMEKLATAVKAEKWEDAQKIGKEFKEYGEAISKNKPKKGELTSWEAHTKGFNENMTAIADGADKKDAKAVNDGITKFRMTCQTCHKDHK